MRKQKHYKISLVGCGNVAYRLSFALKSAGHSIPCIYGRNLNEANKLAYILNKPEILEHIPPATHKAKSEIIATRGTDDFKMLSESDIIIIAVSDNAIQEISDRLFEALNGEKELPVVVHSSGATDISVLCKWPRFGVFYPLMTLSKTKPVDFKLIPFFLEANDSVVMEQISSLCYSLGSEYKVCSSEERLKVHTAAVFVSNFVNYLTGLAFDISGQNQMYLMPLAIETVRKAFLYEHPSLVQTGPAVRDDHQTMNKHIDILENMDDHKLVYETISKLILKQRK
ncbi:MAG: hypothetical protein A2322_00005 [Bacteroidetes bacterium RIFOXYB2_FULL_39_7]|nr:MAG: hypothetical protein A2322_00005 [Bacteroidetes bacterium RIFOXYB2_FULL_39_7]HCT94032.1 hypothetical protein [Rikenellaceae bacterium]